MSALGAYLAGLVAAASPGIAIADGVELIDRAPATWSVDGTTSVGEATFGPFLEPVTFDTAQILSGDEVLQSVPIGRYVIPTGGVHRQRILMGHVDG